MRFPQKNKPKMKPSNFMACNKCVRLPSCGCSFASSASVFVNQWILMKVEVAGLMDPFGHISGAVFFMVTGT